MGHVVHLNKILKSASKYQAEILNSYGYSTEYKEGEAIIKPIQGLVVWLEDIITLAMVDPELVCARYRAGNFSFQKVSFCDT